jgi:hypothetical protein
MSLYGQSRQRHADGRGGRRRGRAIAIQRPQMATGREGKLQALTHFVMRFAPRKSLCRVLSHGHRLRHLEKP